MVGLRVRPKPRRLRTVHRQHALRHAIPPRREPQRGRALHHLHKPDPRIERDRRRRRGPHAHAVRRQNGCAAPHAERREVRRRTRRPLAHVLARRETVQHVAGLRVRPKPRRLRSVHRQHALRRAVPPRREPERCRVLHHLHEPDPRVERQRGRRHRPDRPRARRRTGSARQQPSNLLQYRLHASPPFHRLTTPSNDLRPVNTEHVEARRHGGEFRGCHAYLFIRFLSCHVNSTVSLLRHRISACSVFIDRKLIVECNPP